MISRRSILQHGAITTALTGVAVAIVQCQPTEAPAAVSDPTPELVREYERQWEAYLNSDVYQRWADTSASYPMYGPYDAEVKALAGRTYKPLEVILDADEGLPPVTTLAGAVWCLGYVLGRMDGCCPTKGDENILRAVHAFLEGRMA